MRRPLRQRLGPGDPNVDIAAMLAMPPGSRPEQENLVPRISHFRETNPPGLGEVFLLEGRTGLAGSARV
ncbi:MAG: hypothetical protein NTY87_13485 [Planctomycetia bacterium]|nr:hypothetical protein [Planctomycetia bacterium]